jgi:hypothetical protein
MTLDLPTLERPRNAISGSEGAGKCAASLADVTNRERIRIATVSSFWLLAASGARSRRGLQAEGTFVLDVFFFERVEFMPEGKAAGDHDADQDADEEE